ncbi:DUF6993 domain-containing protein [Arthrobacter sp.]|uniref:DUF6993 domain-containing protein n=1 Tax=Arthrobacter sp. TaxID=1667 RepID=UPI002810AE81|nr:hypothetical protein [Arthrobacter sp.]
MRAIKPLRPTRRTPTPRILPARHQRAAVLAFLVLVASSACTPPAGTDLGDPASPGDSATSNAGSPSGRGSAAPAPTPVALAPATALVRDKVEQALTNLAAGSAKPTRDQMLATLTAAGVSSSALEVSASQTPTGLEVDAIEAAVLQDKDCVIGQVREGKVTVVILPVLSTGKCFAGTQL